MASQHTALLSLPALFESLGGNAVILDGWDTAQGIYLWTDPVTGMGSISGKPSCYMVHHTGSASATPVVKTDSGKWSKANAWAGLYRNGKLYSTGGGVPTVVFTSAGPSRTSSGYGYWAMFETLVLNDIRPPWKAGGPDGDRALNRFAFNVETAHPGDYSNLDSGVWEQLVILGQALHIHFGWRARTISHQSWTRRKIDPRWNHDDQCIATIQDEIEARLAEEDNMQWKDIVDDKTFAIAYDLGYIKGDPALMPDYYFADGPATEAEKKNAYNIIQRNQMRAALGNLPFPE